MLDDIGVEQMLEEKNETVSEVRKTNLLLLWLRRECNQTYLRLGKAQNITKRHDILLHLMKYDYGVFSAWAKIMTNDPLSKHNDYCVAWNTIMMEE